jgi:hypothetical protein
MSSNMVETKRHNGQRAVRGGSRGVERLFMKVIRMELHVLHVACM